MRFIYCWHRAHNMCMFVVVQWLYLGIKFKYSLSCTSSSKCFLFMKIYKSRKCIKKKPFARGDGDFFMWFVSLLLWMVIVGGSGKGLRWWWWWCVRYFLFYLTILLYIIIYSQHPLHHVLSLPLIALSAPPLTFNQIPLDRKPELFISFWHSCIFYSWLSPYRLLFLCTTLTHINKDKRNLYLHY